MALWAGFSVQFWNRIVTLAELKALKKKKKKVITFSKTKQKKKKNSPRTKRFPFAFNQVSAQSDISRSRSDLKMVTVVAILDFIT